MAPSRTRIKKTRFAANGDTPRAGNTLEIGSSGLAAFSGVIQEEFLKELRGKDGLKKYNEMRLNSPVIGALLTAIEQAIRGIDWQYTSDLGEEDPRLELLAEAEANLRHSWNDHIIEALTFLWAGYQLFELVYERVGGRLLWRKFAPRPPETIYQWLFDDEGGIQGVKQQAAPRFQTVEIPIEKLILYRTRVEKNNPEGRSILRASWIPYHFTKHMQVIEGIGVERDIAGLPVIILPPGADTTETDSDTTDYGRARRVVSNVRNDQQAGLVLPPGWDFKLLTSGGSRQFDTDKIIRRYEQRMLMSALAQFLMLGQDSSSSLALSRDQTDFFTMSVNATADIIGETFTKFAIPRLMRLNGYDGDGLRLEHSPAGDVDIVRLADFLQKMSGNITWTADDETWLRQAARLPERTPEEITDEKEERRARMPVFQPAPEGEEQERVEEMRIRRTQNDWLPTARREFESALEQFRSATSKQNEGEPMANETHALERFTQAMDRIVRQALVPAGPAERSSAGTTVYRVPLPQAIDVHLPAPPATVVSVDTRPIAEALVQIASGQRADMASFNHALADMFQFQDSGMAQQIGALARAIFELAQKPTVVNVAAPEVINQVPPTPVNVLLPKPTKEVTQVQRDSQQRIVSTETKISYAEK